MISRLLEFVRTAGASTEQSPGHRLAKLDYLIALFEGEQ